MTYRRRRKINKTDPCVVYLLHFSQPLAHAQHYLGATDNLEARLEAHRAGNGSPLVRAAIAAGIEVSLARTWEGTWELEKQLKRRKHSAKFCPICKELKTHVHA